MKILIVEDELIISLAHTIIVEKEGYELTDNVTSAEDALKSIELTDPDVVILDIQLKGPTNGIELAKTLRKKNDSFIIFTTGNSWEETNHLITEFENCEVLTKPVKEENLIKLLQSINKRINEKN